VEDAEVGVPDGEVFVGADFVIEHEAMSGAVHRLHSISLVLNLEQEHTIFIGLIMTRRFPQFQVEHVR